MRPLLVRPVAATVYNGVVDCCGNDLGVSGLLGAVLV
jgi:hypothetical protein